MFCRKHSAVETEENAAHIDPHDAFKVFFRDILDGSEGKQWDNFLVPHLKRGLRD